MGEEKLAAPKTGSRPDWGSVLHVRTRVDLTWYVAFVLLIFVIVTQFPEDYPLWQRIAFGTAGIGVFFVTLSIRQFLLTLLAIRAGIPIKNVTLFVFGGAARIPGDVTHPALELTMAGYGVLFNLVIAGAFQWLSLEDSITSNPMVVVPVQWSAFFWYTLALLHLAPGFPLEGGRVLLAILWKRTRDYGRAVRISSWTGWVIGLIFGLGGVALLLLFRDTVNGLLLTFIGWALVGAATRSRHSATLLEALHNTKARDVMTREFPAIAPQTTLGQVVKDYSLVTGQHYFPVAEKGRLVGVVTLADINRIPREQRDSTLVEEIMAPVRKVATVRADQTAAHAIERMDQSRTDRLPVLERDEVIGVVVRDSLVSLARIRKEHGT